MENGEPHMTELASKGKITILDYKIVPPSASLLQNENVSDEDYNSGNASEKSNSSDEDYDPMADDLTSTTSFDDENSYDGIKSEYLGRTKSQNAFSDNFKSEKLAYGRVPESQSQKQTERTPSTSCFVHHTSEAEKLSPKQDLCPFCFETVGHFSRHLSRKHSEEDTVAKIFNMKKKERRLAIIALRRKGNFILNKELNKLKPVRKPNNSENTEGVYYPCTNCLGFFKKSYLWRHKKKCNTLTGIKKSQCRTNHLSEAQTLLQRPACLEII
nr:unnamed protein product [Callosobruchus analis]